jgi:hypothetical protein
MLEIGTQEFDNLNSEGSSATGFEVSVVDAIRDKEPCLVEVFIES